MYNFRLTKYLLITLICTSILCGCEKEPATFLNKKYLGKITAVSFVQEPCYTYTQIYSETHVIRLNSIVKECQNIIGRDCYFIYYSDKTVWVNWTGSEFTYRLDTITYNCGDMF